MNSANDQVKTNAKVTPMQSSVTIPVGTKEMEPVAISSAEVQPVSSEIEIPEEVEKAGVIQVHDTIELPPDIKKIGVTVAGSSIPAVTSTVLPQVTLPISDDQVVSGLHAQVVSALRWLAEWCMKKLKKAHVTLKTIHGKIIRVKTK